MQIVDGNFPTVEEVLRDVRNRVLGVDGVADVEAFEDLLLNHLLAGHVAAAGGDDHGHDALAQLIEGAALIGRAFGSAEQLDDPALDVALEIVFVLSADAIEIFHGHPMAVDGEGEISLVLLEFDQRETAADDRGHFFEKIALGAFGHPGKS